MLIFLLSLICATAIFFASVPVAVNHANRIHLQNGREPNAEVSIVPPLIVIIGLWWGVGATLKYFLGSSVALSLISIISAIIFMYLIFQALKSNREYTKFVDALSSEDTTIVDN